MTARDRARTTLAAAQETAVKAHALARRYPHNYFYRTVADRAKADLARAINAAQSRLDPADDGGRHWVAFWLEAGRRRVRLIKEMQRLAAIGRLE